MHHAIHLAAVMSLLDSIICLHRQTQSNFTTTTSSCADRGPDPGVNCLDDDDDDSS